MRKVNCDHCGKILKEYFPKEHARKDIGKIDDLCCLDEQNVNYIRDKEINLINAVMQVVEHEFDLCDECISWLYDSFEHVISGYFNTQKKEYIQNEIHKKTNSG